MGDCGPRSQHNGTRRRAHRRHISVRRFGPTQRLPPLRQSVCATHTTMRSVPGDIDAVNMLKVEVDKGEPLRGLPDAHVPASALKLWFRELADPLIPDAFYDQCLASHDSPEQALAAVQNIPELNRTVVHCIVCFLR